MATIDAVFFQIINSAQTAYEVNALGHATSGSVSIGAINKVEVLNEVAMPESFLMYLQALDQWDWYALALVLLVLEVFVSGAFFLWFGISAGLVGVVVTFSPILSWKIQLILFALGSASSLVGWYIYKSKHPDKRQAQGVVLNQRGHACIGKTYTLSEPIVDGKGKLVVDDATWHISGPDCKKGAHVKVEAMDGMVLKITLIEE